MTSSSERPDIEQRTTRDREKTCWGDCGGDRRDQQCQRSGREILGHISKKRVWRTEFENTILHQMFPNLFLYALPFLNLAGAWGLWFWTMAVCNWTVLWFMLWVLACSMWKLKSLSWCNTAPVNEPPSSSLGFPRGHRKHLPVHSRCGLWVDQ